MRDPDILLVADAGYDGPRLAHVLADLPITVVARMRSDRVAGLLDAGRPRAGSWTSVSGSCQPNAIRSRSTQMCLPFSK